jgi:hypothetical protein
LSQAHGTARAQESDTVGLFGIEVGRDYFEVNSLPREFSVSSSAILRSTAGEVPEIELSQYHEAPGWCEPYQAAPGAPLKTRCTTLVPMRSFNLMSGFAQFHRVSRPQARTFKTTAMVRRRLRGDGGG